MDKTNFFSLPPVTRGAGPWPGSPLPGGWLFVAELGGVWPGSAAARLADPCLSARDLRAQRGSRTVPATLPEIDEQSVAHQVIAEELDYAERLVLLLFYAEGLTFADIAEVLDLPVAAVERLYRATMATLEERLR
jgi:hypothetical protein